MASSGQDQQSGPGQGPSSASPTNPPRRPTEALINTQSTSAAISQEGPVKTSGRKNHRAGRKKKKPTRRQSFQEDEEDQTPRLNRNTSDAPNSAARPSLYRLGQSGGRNLSETSLASEALLDHRDHQPLRPRRESRVGPSQFARQSNNDLPQRPAQNNRNGSYDVHGRQSRYNRAHNSSGGGSDEDDEVHHTDRTPLISSAHHGASPTHRPGYGMFGTPGRNHNRRASNNSSRSSRYRRGILNRNDSASGVAPVHDVNNPPSVPNSPKMGPDVGFDDVMVGNSFTKTSEDRRGDQLIDIDGDGRDSSQRRGSIADQRRHTIALPAEEDVCFPVEGMSAIGEEDYQEHEREQSYQHEGRRRRFRQWPDLSVLDEWSREEKEERSEGIRAKKISEPVLVGGRLRPQKHGWHRAEEDAPYRFTYFNEEFPSTIHSQTISELLQEGQNFRELFIPDPPELSDSSSDEEDLASQQGTLNERQISPNSHSRLSTRHPSVVGMHSKASTHPTSHSGDATPSQSQNPSGGPDQRPKRYGERPTFWLDVLSPTDTEMRVISKTFGIHPLTAEDILMQEAREKVELFRNYYFVNYRTFEQDTNSEDFLEPVNMYVVVFPEGVISFHFSMTPHPANVRRRIRQLRDYIRVSSDWISYAIIDDITDVFAPLIQSIEEEVDDIDDAILKLHSADNDAPGKDPNNEKRSNDGRSDTGENTSSGGDMLRRVGEGRKKVMLLYRLLGNKADVIKGFAKRCNEKWEIAPRSDIGLYLGDIQDHILTMTSNLSHYETLLSRAHSNYLAQINIRMNERQEQTADVLGKLTVLGTIVLPMNIITGMWGMNVLVPGQETPNLIWFWSITGGLLVFGISCFFIAKRVYGIV